MPRPGPALFELIRGSTGSPTIPARSTGSPKPLVRVTPKPQPAATPEPPVPAATDSKSDKAWAAWTGKRSWLKPGENLTVRTSTILIIAGAAVVILAITWAIAYSLGSRRGEDRVKRDLTPAVTPESIPLNPNLVQSPLQAPEVRPVPDRPSPQHREQPPITTADPRVPGMNYYLLAAGLDKDTADRMVAFLNQGGLPSAAAVDKAASGSNNRGSYIVFATKGLTSDEYKKGTLYPARAEVVNKAANLGKVWQREHKGQTDFSQGYWKKFAG
jgi:hypothetical protein